MLTDTVKFARAAGESEWTMLRRHVLRLISIPLVTVFGLELGSTLAFAVVTETIFSWPGIGKLIIDSIASLDRPVMVAYLMLVAFVFIMINFTVDIAYVGLDPAAAARRGRDGPRDPVRASSGASSARTASRSPRSASSCSIVLLAVLAPLVAPQDPYDLAKLTLRDARRPPGFVGAAGYVHWLGTDAQGRDMFSAILYGLRISLQIGVSRGADRADVGRHARRGRGLSRRANRGADHADHRPAAVVSRDPAGAGARRACSARARSQLTIALVAAQYAYFARTAHGAAVAERSKEYVEAALSMPLPVRTVVFRHILPNCLPPLIVVATVQIANSIALEATLSFLGLGLPPTEPSLGMLIANGFQYMLSGRYWISIYPGIALIVLIVAINLVGDQIRDQLNPAGSKR